MLRSFPRYASGWLPALAVVLLLALPALGQQHQMPTRRKPVSRPAATQAQPAADDSTKAAPARPAAAVARNGVIGATYQFSTDPAVFPEEVRRLLDGQNKTEVTKTAQMFQATWSAGRFSAPQQQRIIALTQLMVQKRFKTHPHFEQLFGSLVSAVNVQELSGSALDDLLNVFEKTMANEPPAAMARLLSTVNLVLSERVLFQTKGNSLKFTGGAFAFQYYDADNPAPVFGSPVDVKPAEEAKPEPPKPAPKPAAPKKKTTKKPAPKKAAPKNNDWGAAEPATAKQDDGWGAADDGWGTPAPKKKAAPKPAPKKDDGWGDAAADDGWGAPAKTAAKPAAKPAPKKEEDEWGAPAKASGGNDSGWNDNFDEAVLDQPNPKANKDTGIIPYTPEPIPFVTGAALVVKDVDLQIRASFDSTGALIQKTTGAVMLTTGQFVGNGGTYAWQPSKGNEAKVTLGQYFFQINKPYLKAESATLDYPSVIEAPVKGVFEYKSSRRDRRGQLSYPRFASFSNDARIKSLGSDIRYRGGLALAGSRLSTSALDHSNSTLTLMDGDSVRLRAQSNAFQLGDSLITATRAAVTMMQHRTDSVTHPGIKFKYAKSKHLLILVRGDGIYRSAPYIDSYHNMEVSAEMLTWDVRSPYMNFSMITAKNQVFAKFASKDYYTDNYYQQQKTISRYHPLKLVLAYADEKKQNEFYLIDLAENRQIPQATLHRSMISLARDGFIDYNGVTGEVTLRPKLRHYVQASKGKTDYDHLIINSLSPSGKNATLNLQKNELLVRGVERFNFAADTVDVYAEPDSGFVRIMKDRNMKFNGRLTANELAFVGSDFQFDYKGFWIDLNQIDSTIVRTKQVKKKKKKAGIDDEEDPKGPKMVLTNRGKRSSGRLYLNRPDNKSGRKPLGQYPTFESQSPAFIAFNDASVQGGVYDSTVYFEVPPFKLDSLGGKNKTPVGLKGTFHSGKIFPPFETEMKLQPDGSTGFTYQVPKAGMPAYGGKGQFFSTLKMDGNGLQGEGSLKVKDALIKSDQFVFYLDSAVAVGREVTIAESATAPRLKGANFLMKWFAERDSLAMTADKDEPFKLYADTSVTLSGTIAMTPRGLGGAGTLETDMAMLTSADIMFHKQDFEARHGMFEIKTDDPKKPALRARDASVKYNKTGGYAEFAPEKEGAATTELTAVQYRTSLPGGRWDFKKKRVLLKAREGDGIAKSYFVSTRPDQKGLRWPAGAATYDLEKLQLKATGVPYITVGDARIQPDSLRVIVAQNAKMEPFKKAIITMDTLTRFHRLYDGEIQIASRMRFTGAASYRYKTGQGDSTTIRFNDFRVDSASVLLRPDDATADVSEATSKKSKKNKTPSSNLATSLGPGLVTMARANVGDKEQVLVAPRVQYRGGVAIISRRKGLINDGEGKLKFSSNPQASDWFAIRDSLDPNNLRFPIGGLHAADGAALSTGIMRSDDSGKLYPLYVGIKQNEMDVPIFEVGDELAYDKPRDLFTLGNQKRDGFEVNEGNVMTFSGKNGATTWRGKMRFIGGNENFNIEAAGIGSGIPDSNQYEVEAMLAFDIKGMDKPLDIMGENLLKSTPQHPRAVQLGDQLTSKIGDFVGSRAAKDFNAVKPGQQPTALPKFNPRFNRALVFNEIKFKWSRKNRAWYSIGPINLSNVLGTNVNASLDGFMEIKRAPEGDVVEFIVEADPNTWYHFKYANNTLLTWSSWENYYNEVTAKQKGDYNVATAYGVYAGDDFQKDQFRNWFLKQYRSEEERRKLRRAGSSFNASPTPRPAADSFQEDAAADTGKKKKKKDKEADAPTPESVEQANPNSDAAPAEGKKKKKKDEETAPAQETPAAEPANSNFSDEPAPTEGKKKKKKKDTSTEDPFAEPTSPQ